MFGVLKSQFSPRGVVEGEGPEGGKKDMHMTGGSKDKVVFSSFFELQNS